MDAIYILIGISLLLFMILATYDGFYLHLWKYKLYKHDESTFEHKTHTIRAVLFPIIVWSLLLQNSFEFFVFGMILTAIDLLVLGIDAYSEKDSRQFMGGLPKWEYIIHLFANGFHYAIIVLTIALRITFVNDKIVYVIHEPKTISAAFNFLTIVAENAIPGAIVIALLHLLLIFDKTQNYWETYRLKVTCC